MPTLSSPPRLHERRPKRGMIPPETGNGFLTGKKCCRMHFVDLARKQVESELELV
jgi:hypothetical protein